ncbi:hypothetical protein MICRO116_70013 [Micrococcus sp. 116]|nr:hypothetical protein MICRO116_70013 [Micrococcus sp. 116]
MGQSRDSVAEAVTKAHLSRRYMISRPSRKLSHAARGRHRPLDRKPMESRVDDSSS